MFVRFRKIRNRTQVSILEARRTAGKVRNEHIASLGSIAQPMTVAGRQSFWANLWDRLASLSNRIGPDDQAKIKNAVHARIPTVMPDEVKAAEAQYWDDWRSSFLQSGAREREGAAAAIDRAEWNEEVAAMFAENRADVLKGEHPGQLIVGKLLALKLGYKSPADGAKVIMANGEEGIYREAKRPDRNDRRRRRNGLRFTPKRADTT
jgi:hypothetical protein